MSKLAKGFRTVRGPMASGDLLCKPLPVDAVPVLARPGMAVRGANLAGDCGQIMYMTPEFCVVKCDSGEVDAMRWHEVELDHVQPDPAFLPPPPDFGTRTAAPPAKRRRGRAA